MIGLVTISFWNVIKTRGQGIHGKAWIFFAASMTSWFVAEMIWFGYDMILNIDPFPSLADYFYILGYPIFFAFSILYLKPVWAGITKKILILACGISFTLIIPGIMIGLDAFSGDIDDEFVFAMIYPIADSLVLVPAITAVILFLNGRVNFMWTSSLIGILFLGAADVGFMTLEFEDAYYTGHPIEIIFLWAYLFLMFGVYDHMKIFRKKGTNSQKNINTSSE